MTGWEIAGSLLKPLTLILEWLLKHLRGESVPRRIMRVVPDDDRHYTWYWGKDAASGGMLMAVRGSFHLTAIDRRVNVEVIRTYLLIRYWDRWRFRRVKAGGHTSISDGRGYEGMWSDRYPIPSGATREVIGNWLIDPAFRKEGDHRPLRARAYFVDQFDNPHAARSKLSFRFQR